MVKVNLMGFTIQARVEGVEKAIKSLDALGRTVKNQILRKAMRAGARIIITAARAKVPVDTATLKKSFSVKLKAYRQSGVMVAVVGPRTGMKKQVGTRIRGAHKGEAVYRNPAKIAHLVEKGHARGKGKAAAPPHAFLKPALDETTGQVRDAVIEAIQAGIEQVRRA
jgi:HK97 gp10 family phage protein